MEVIKDKCHISIIRHYLDKGASANEPNEDGDLPLHCAIKVNYMECAELLISEGANLNRIDNSESTPMMIAARSGNYEALEILINNGAIVNYCDGSNIPENIRQLGFLTYDPLNMAAEHNHHDCVRLLLEMGANPNKVYYMGHELSLVPLSNLKCIEMLLKYGSNPNHLSDHCLTPLARACRENKMDAVEVLLRYGADVNLSCNKPHWNTPINFAVKHASVAILSKMMVRNASLARQDKCRYSPLQKAVLAGRKKICKLLLKQHAQVDELSEDGRTSLMLAVNGPRELIVDGPFDRQPNSKKDIIKILLKNGADVNLLMPDSGKSIIVDYLRLSKNKPDTHVMRLLICYGARINLRSSDNDPFGVLEFLHKLVYWEVFYLVCDASKHIDTKSVMECIADNRLLEYQTEYVRTPRSLQIQLRLFIRERVQCVNNIKSLDIPQTLRKFLKFD